MPATRYKVWQFAGQVGSTAMAPHHVGVAGVAKTNSQAQPNAVATELICSQLGRILLLPVPPGFIIEHNNKLYFTSLNFNLSGHDLPPIDPDTLIQAQPKLSCGIILFDIWIVNGDRHTRNIAFDTRKNKVQIFDHSHAFYTGANAKHHLTQNENKISIGSHCLAAKIASFDGMKKWYNKIQEVPEYYIRELVNEAATVGLPSDSVDFCAEYLIRRRGKLIDLVKQNQNAFPNVPQDLFDGLDLPGGT